MMQKMLLLCGGRGRCAGKIFRGPAPGRTATALIKEGNEGRFPAKPPAFRKRMAGVPECLLPAPETGEISHCVSV